MNKYLSDYLSSRDYNKITDDCIDWIRTWFKNNGDGCTAVIGISGGKDSSTVAALCCEAIGKDRVFGIMMPNGTQSDISVSRSVIDFLGIESREVNIATEFDTFISSMKESGIEPSKQTVINLPPRIRMATLYAFSQSLNGRVSNNCNLSENYVGYSTLFGDAAGDFSPLGALTVSEIKIMGKILGLPDMFVDKAPSDGLTGSTDEDNFGFTYEDLDTYILTSHCDDPDIKAKIDKRHNSNLFKLKPMAEFNP